MLKFKTGKYEIIVSAMLYLAQMLQYYKNTVLFIYTD